MLPAEGDRYSKGLRGRREEADSSNLDHQKPGNHFKKSRSWCRAKNKGNV